MCATEPLLLSSKSLQTSVSGFHVKRCTIKNHYNIRRLMCRILYVQDNCLLLSYFVSPSLVGSQSAFVFSPLRMRAVITVIPWLCPVHLQVSPWPLVSSCPVLPLCHKPYLFLPDVSESWEHYPARATNLPARYWCQSSCLS
jgi:hypothetical protein